MTRTLAGIVLMATPALYAQNQAEYEIAFSNAVHHEAEITVTLRELPPVTLELRMSRSSPGRYALHEFGKNVYSVKACNGRGQTLAISRPDPYQWDITGHDGEVKVTYTLFADHASGTYSGIDETHAHLNMPATFLWARGLRDRAIQITIEIPTGSNWRAATQLEPTGRPNVFRAPNLDYFLDSPVELSDHARHEWVVKTGGLTQTIRLALHHEGTDKEGRAYAELAKAVVLEQEGIFGELPRFDYGAYTFLADYLPHVAGDGMEHRNSTVIASKRPLKTQAIRNLGTLAHEFLHCWNVERLRPRSLEPFDLERANMSGELWFAEGFTSYYAPLTLVRAQIISLDRYAQQLSELLNAVVNAPGRRYFSAVEMSLHAPLVDGATASDPNNRANTFVSYYAYGHAIALGLDLTLRSRFENLSLDDFMRAAWQKYGKAEVPYSNEELQQILGEMTSTAFAEDFFRRYVFGKELMAYEPLLAQAGLLVRQARARHGYLGKMKYNFTDSGATLKGPAILDTPLYRAGLDKGARVIELDGKSIISEANFNEVIESHQPGDAVPIVFEQRGIEKRTTITFVEDPTIEVVPFEHVSQSLAAAMEKMRRQWLGSKASQPLPLLQRCCPTCNRAFPYPFEFCHFDGAELQFTSAGGE